MIFVKRKKTLLSMLLIAALMLSLVTPVFAAYEQDSYIKLHRSLDPNQTTVEPGSEQDINYVLTGDEFELDPALVDTNNLLQKNIALVLDISGSMDDILDPVTHKTRLMVLKESVNKFLDHFANSNTYISIIPYSNVVTTFTSLLPMKPGGISYLKNYVAHDLIANGATNIGDGMRMAYWQLKKTPHNSANYMVVMTDGEPNCISVNNPGSKLKFDDGLTFSYLNTSTVEATDYAKAIGALIAEANITSYFVGLVDTPSAPLEEIALSANAAETTPGSYYYKVINASDVDDVFSNILVNEIASTLPMQVNFNETLPEGVEVVSLPAGLTQSVLGDGRVQITGQISNISLQKNDVTGKYSISPSDLTIRVKYTTVGVKNFDNLQVDYVDPFGNSKTADIMNPITVLVALPNNAPIANAGTGVTVEATSPAGASVTLDGSGSSDPDSDPLTYTWSGVFGTASGKTPTVQLPIGTHSITLTVSDGDLSSSDTVEIRVVDSTLPEITGTKSPNPNADGWYNTDVTVHFMATDSGSGIQSVTPDTVVSTEGVNQSVTGTAIDLAGNWASTTVGGINIDKTGPEIVDSTLAAGSFKSTDKIVIDFTATDALSGLDWVEARLNGTAVTKGQSIPLKSKAGSNILEITAADKAGNVTVETLPFAVDVNVNVSIKPETLNPKSQGGDNSITVKIDFPAGNNVASIDLQSTKLFFNGSSINAVSSNLTGDGAFTVKFNRQDLIALIGNQSGKVMLILTGNISGGAGFVGFDTINVLPK